MSDFTHIAWLDLETTGLEPNLGEILEIGIVLTDTDLSAISDHSWLVLPKQIDLLTLSPVVREMHTANGLFDALVKLNQTRWPHGHGTSLVLGADIASRAEQIGDWLREKVPGLEQGQIALGGSGVSHFDIRWLQHHAPTLAKLFYRSTVDIGVMRRFIENVAKRSELVPPETRNLNHRALDDARQHLAEARYYRNLFSSTLELARSIPLMGERLPACGRLKRWEWGYDVCDLPAGHASPLHGAGEGVQRRIWSSGQ